MQWKNRLMALLLCMSMVVSMLPMNAFADTEDLEVPAQEQETTVDENQEEKNPKDEPVKEEILSSEDEEEEIPSQEDSEEEGSDPVEEEHPDIVGASFTGMGDTVYFEDSTEDMLWAYLYGAGGISAYSIDHARDSLNETEKIMYDKAMEMIAAVASGDRTSTMTDYFTIDEEFCSHKWTASELGFDSFIVDGEVVDGIFAAFMKKFTEKHPFDMLNVLLAVKFDCPFEMFWGEKIRLTYSFPETYFEWEDGEYKIPLVPEFSVIIIPAEGFRGANETTVDRDAFSSVTTAKSNIDKIVQRYAGYSDEAKLAAYRDKICDLVTYNSYAADDNNHVPYGNPWQLIWVFDEDPTTNVVCEGYSKAFQYLCELSSFTTVQSVFSVTGELVAKDGRGPHMWNIVRFKDGRNRLVDVTNYASGHHYLFLALPDSGDLDNGYTFTDGSNTLSFVYDDETKAFFSAEELTLSDKQPVGEKAVLQSANLTLEGQIGVNFYMTIPESMQGGYVLFTFRGAEKKVPVSDVTMDAKGRFKFTQLVAAKEMNDIINLKLLAPDGTPYAVTIPSGTPIPDTGFNYAVKDYLKAAEQLDENTRDFAQKMASYGAYAQILLGYNAESAQGGDVSSVTKTTLAPYNYKLEGKMPTGLILKSMTLILESETSMRVYLNAADMADYTVTIDGITVVPQKLGDAYYVQISNIAAKDLDENHVLKFTNGTDTATLTVSGLTYGAMTLNQNEGQGTKTAECNVSKALYLYCMAAQKVVR